MGTDVFLSHNSHDKPLVRELAALLEARGLRVWLDETHLTPGRNWQPLLEQGIEEAASGAVLVGADGLGPWEDEEMQALLRRAVSAGKPVIPVLLPGAPARPRLPLFLANRTWVDLREGFADAPLDRLVWGITGERQGAPPVPPPKRRRRRLVLAGLAALLVAGVVAVGAVQLLGDRPQVLAGVVRDGSGQPLPGVRIALPAYGATTVTDALGGFELRVAAPREAHVELLAQAQGFAPRRQYVMLGAERLGLLLNRSPP